MEGFPYGFVPLVFVKKLHGILGHAALMDMIASDRYC